MQDWTLLRQYVEQNSQEAFATLTRRYVNLVYSTCLREVGDAALAEDVTQTVFLVLARKAPALRAETRLPGWLFQTARFASRNALTHERRQRLYEQKAAQMKMDDQAAQEDALWEGIEPLLNSAMARLSATDRDALLLRYFEGESLAATGAALGLSEDAARKRVRRAVEKLRRFFEKEGVVVTGGALAALLPAHAVKAAPVICVPAIAQATASVLKGHVSTSLIGSHLYQTSEGVLRAMKIAKIKAVASVTVVALVGLTAYTVVRGDVSRAGATVHTPAAELAAPIPSEKDTFPPGGGKDAYRSVVLTGKVRYEDGKPAGGVLIAAQIQNKALDALMQPVVALGKRQGIANGVSIRVTKEQQEESWNNTVSKPDGSYALPIGAGLPYNVMVFDNTGRWVAAAAEGVSGVKGATVAVPDLTLTHGSILAGTITDSGGKPVVGVSVASYGPQWPQSSAAVIGTQTDSSGHYRLRVAPGRSRVYIVVVSPMGGGPPVPQDVYVDVAAGETQTVDFTTTPGK